MLVAAGASLTMRDANGLTPMMIAFQVEDNDLATYLESERLFFIKHKFMCMQTVILWDSFYSFYINGRGGSMVRVKRVNERYFESANFEWTHIYTLRMHTN